jgi:phospholipid transport system transporter-binding protein
MMAERNAGADGVGSVAQIADGERWTVAGPITFADAGPVLEATRTLALPASGIVDCRGIGSVDSAAVALLLAWKRRATTEGRPLVFDGIPAALVLLADLYGVREILTA